LIEIIILYNIVSCGNEWLNKITLYNLKDINLLTLSPNEFEYAQKFGDDSEIHTPNGSLNSASNE